MIWTMIYKKARRLAASLLFHTQWTSEPSYFIQMDSIGTQIEMLKTNIQFESVCEQIRLLNHRLDALQTRYSRATSGSNNRARYTLRHTKDHHKNKLPLCMACNALGLEFGSAARLSKRRGSVSNCLWGHALKNLL